MIQELDTVIPAKDYPDQGLVKGDMDAAVMIHGGQAFEVEFVTMTGDPLGVLILAEDEIRTVSARDVPHVRVA